MAKMSNLIQILPKIWGVKVPMDADNFHIAFGTDTFVSYNFDLIKIVDDKMVKFKILGTVTKSEISFDASEVVDRHKNCKRYICSKNKGVAKRYYDSAEQSFRSALPDEIYWENELEEPNHLDYKHRNEWNELVFTPRNLERYSEDYDNWNNAKDKITEKLLILQEV